MLDMSYIILSFLGFFCYRVPSFMKCFILLVTDCIGCSFENEVCMTKLWLSQVGPLISSFSSIVHVHQIIDSCLRLYFSLQVDEYPKLILQNKDVIGYNVDCKRDLFIGSIINGFPLPGEIDFRFKRLMIW